MIDHVVRVWDMQGMTPQDKLFLLTLADQCGENTKFSNPAALQSVAARSCMTLDDTLATIQRLQQLGIVYPSPENGVPDLWHLDLDRLHEVVS